MLYSTISYRGVIIIVIITSAEIFSSSLQHSAAPTLARQRCVLGSYIYSEIHFRAVNGQMQLHLTGKTGSLVNVLVLKGAWKSVKAFEFLKLSKRFYTKCYLLLSEKSDK